MPESRATPFGRWLDAQGLTAIGWAQAHPLRDRGNRFVLDDAGKKKLRWSPSAVRGWMQPRTAEGARAVPEEAAELIAIESAGAVPAVDASWPSGISRLRRR